MATRGYTRPLVAGEDLQDEIESLAAAGAESVVVETSPRSSQMLESLIGESVAGDRVLITTLDRLADKLSLAASAIVRLARMDVRLECLDSPGLDLSAPPAVAVLAELESAHRRLRSRHTRHGMAASARRPGRPSALSAEQVDVARELRRFDRSYAHIARVLGVSASAVQRALASDAADSTSGQPPPDSLDR